MKKTSFLVLAVLLFGLVIAFFPVPKVKAAITVTKTFTTSTSDGHIGSLSGIYSLVHDSATGSVLDDSSQYILGQQYTSYYSILRGFVFFDTSSIADSATIDNATLSIYITNDESDDDFNVTIQDGQPTYPHDPLATGDFYYDHYSGDGGSANTSTISGAGYWNITLNDDGLDMISLNETTKLALFSSEDIAESAPTGDEYITFYGREEGINYAAKLYVTYTIQSGDYYSYLFYGPFDEETGANLDENVTISVFLSEESSYESFEFNRTYTYNSIYLIQYFRFTFADNSTREYWVDPSESLEAEVYVFHGNTTGNIQEYTINFIDTTGILATYPYVTVKRYINGTLYTVEKRKVDAYNNILANLIQGRTYKVYLGNEETTYIWGDLVMTSTTGVQLIIRGVDFPKDTLFLQDNVRLYMYRDFGNNTIYVFYDDGLEETVDVDIFIFYGNGTNVYIETVSAHSFSFSWTSADDDTDYRIDVYVHHDTYGTLPYHQLLKADIALTTPPFDLAFLGDWGFDSTFLIPAFIILCVAGCFSALNAEVGAILTCIAAIILTVMGWIPIPIGSLVAAIVLAFLMALIYHKRRGVAY